MDLAKTMNRSALRVKGGVLAVKGRVTHRKRTDLRGRAFQFGGQARSSARRLGHRLHDVTHR